MGHNTAALIRFRHFIDGSLALASRRRTLGVRPVSELGWESADQVVAGDPAAYVLPQHFGDRRDGGRAGACFLDGNGPGDRQIVDG
jgi:hypothetical protein